jgi:2-dehydropantoate 2-reductase
MNEPRQESAANHRRLEVCVFGAGAVGGYLAALLAKAGTHRISVIARGPHLQAIRSDGLQLIDIDGSHRVRFAAAVDSAAQLPPQDIVFVTVKAQSQAAVAESVHALLKPTGHAVFISNGVPWWWSHGLRMPSEEALLVDPDRRLWNQLGPTRVLGGVIYSANEVTAPGTVVHQANNHWLIGEPTNELTPRLNDTVAMMSEAGLHAEASTDLRQQVWRKLLRNTPFNPLCALTRLCADQFAGEPALVALAQSLIEEVRSVARAKGWELPDMRAADVVASGGAISGARAVGKPSMLQDALAGRPMELDAVVGQVQHFARQSAVSTPTLDLVHTLLRGLNLGFSRTQG